MPPGEKELAKAQQTTWTHATSAPDAAQELPSRSQAGTRAAPNAGVGEDHEVTLSEQVAGPAVDAEKREHWPDQGHPEGPADEGEGNHDLENARTTASSSAPLHSVFTRGQRRFIVTMAAIAGFFSPFSANIYFPALNAISSDYKESPSIINLTLTSYMIFQGLAPTFFGDLGDAAGRRPAYIIGFVIYIGACIGIALQHSFAALFILRCVQSTGSSGTVALASGVAADIATSAERGTYMGWVTSGAMVGPAIGPILGGILSQYLGWRWIFWFLAILAGAYMIPLVIAFPETGRNVVGNGSIPPQSWNRSLLNYLQVRRSKARSGKLERTESRSPSPSTRRLKIPNPLNTLKIILEPDVCMLLLYNSLVYTAFYDVVASLPYLFGQIYHFDDLQIGLSFIPFGVGCLISPVLNGKLLDWNFRRVARKNGFDVDRKRQQNLKDFPLEHARVPIALPLILVGDAAVLCYGWVMEAEVHLAAPLVILFVMGLTLTGSFNVMSVMLCDYYPMSPATATAGNNLVRCWMGAGGTAVVIYMIDAMGRGWCFTFVAGVVLLGTSTLLVLLKWGPGWREKRRAKMEMVAEERKDEEKDKEDGGSEKN